MVGLPQAGYKLIKPFPMLRPNKGGGTGLALCYDMLCSPEAQRHLGFNPLTVSAPGSGNPEVVLSLSRSVNLTTVKWTHHANQSGHQINEPGSVQQNEQKAFHRMNKMFQRTGKAFQRFQKGQDPDDTCQGNPKA